MWKVDAFAQGALAADRQLKVAMREAAGAACCDWLISGAALTGAAVVPAVADSCWIGFSFSPLTLLHQYRAVIVGFMVGVR